MFLGTCHVFTFSTFSGLAEIPFANKKWPRKSTLVWKNWHFLGLIFKLNCFSLFNTSSIWCNKSSIEWAKMQMSPRYSNRVTNYWSPKHCSFKLQKLKPAFKIPNDIWINSYKPIELALNAVFLMSLSSIISWRYPCPRPKEENQLLLWTACRASSILGSGKVSLTKMELSFQ